MANRERGRSLSAERDVRSAGEKGGGPRPMAGRHQGGRRPHPPIFAPADLNRKYPLYFGPITRVRGARKEI